MKEDQNRDAKVSAETENPAQNTPEEPEELPALFHQPISARSEFAYLFQETTEHDDVYDYVVERVQAQRGEAGKDESADKQALSDLLTAAEEKTPKPEPTAPAQHTILRDISLGESDSHTRIWKFLKSKPCISEDAQPVVQERLMTDTDGAVTEKDGFFTWIQKKIRKRKQPKKSAAESEVDIMGYVPPEPEKTAEPSTEPDAAESPAESDTAEPQDEPDTVESPNELDMVESPDEHGATELSDECDVAELPDELDMAELPDEPDTMEPSAKCDVAELSVEPDTVESSTEPDAAESQDEPDTAEPPVESDAAEPQDEPDTAEPQDEPDTAKSQDEPDTAKSQDEPDTAEPPDEPDTAELSVEPDTSESPNELDMAESPDEPDTAKSLVEPDIAELPNEPDTAKSQAEPDAAELSDEPDTAEPPDEPDTAELSDEPDAAESPDEPNAAESPDEPDAAELPDECDTADQPKAIRITVPEKLYRPLNLPPIRPETQPALSTPVQTVYERITRPIRRRRKKENFSRKLHLSAVLLKESAAALETIAVRRARKTGVSVREKIRRVLAALTPGAILSRARSVSDHPLSQYQRRALNTQMIYALTAGVLLIVLRVCLYFDALPALSPTHFPVRYALLQTLLLIGGILAGNRTVFGGIRSLLRRNTYAGADGLTGILLFVCLIQSINAVFRPAFLQRGQISLFGIIGLLTLGLNALGKQTVCARVEIGKTVAQADPAESVCLLREDSPLQVIADRHMPDRLTVCTQPGADGAAFAENTAEPDGGQRLIARLSVVLLILCSLIGIIGGWIGGSFDVGWSMWTAALCVCVPMSATLAMNVPLLRAAHRMKKHGAAVAGWSGVSLFGETGRLVVSDSALFPGEALVLRQIKTIRDSRIDSAILDAAAVLRQSGGPMCTLFNRILRENQTVIPQAEQVRLEPDGGATGWVNGRRVIIGNGETLKKFGIQPPSRDYERKNCPPDKRFAYLAVAGELTAMFIMSYEADPALCEAIQRFVEEDGCITVLTGDANLTAPFISECFGLPPESVQTVPYATLDEPIAVEPDSINQAAAAGGCVSVIRLIQTCVRIKPLLQLASALQLAGILLGLLLTAMFAFSGAAGQWNDALIFLFEMFWLAAVIGVPSVKKI